MLLVVVPALLLVPGWWQRAVIVACAVAAGVLVWRVSLAEAAATAAPVEELTRRAERVEDGPVIFEPLRSGIDEIDRISQVFEGRAAELTRTLAAEREFASDASHQLRTPLTALLIRLDEISMSEEIAEVHGEAMVAIDQVERLTGVVDKLLQRARETPGGGPLPTISLDSVIAELQREWQPSFASARRSVKVSGERGLQVISTRSGLLQILATLLENTLHHGDGTVEVMARRNGPSVVVEVSDAGKGVDPSLAPHIFKRRVSTGGTGLGLALARDLAQANGGRLELRSSQPAVFALFLSEGTPVRSTLPDRPATSAELGAPGQAE
ncbi:HAMP domain-containing histidine kinase [Flexivirga sp. ID2601S]|uniref:histidine kinase n=2 Tax=Flexivirga aerilata TaxID=1656889 RepID=A0A849AK03_9MICO|nr:HAMP domain-containing histidine kinase [Flexivirga aerilata]